MSSENSEFVYIQFDRSSETGLIQSFSVARSTEQLANVKSISDKVEPESEEAREASSPFAALSNDFHQEMLIFQRSVPFMMGALPIVTGIEIEHRIQHYVQQHGERLGDDEANTYRIPVHCLSEITRRMERINAILDGVRLVPTLAFIGLVAEFDLFVARLIRTIFVVRPEILSSSDKNISFRDLIELGSIEQARERLVDREVEAIMRTSHPDQIGWIENRLGIDLRKNDIWCLFIEICERRNLFTHTGGVVSSQYIRVCGENGCKIPSSKLGEKLKIDPEYFSSSVSTLLEYGIKVIQIVWRKLSPSDITRAAAELNEFSYSLLLQKNYKLAARILRFGLEDMKKYGNERIRRMMIVNYANSEKLAGNTKRAMAIIDAEDWTAADKIFSVCIAAVKEDIPTLCELMFEESAKREIGSRGFREWPVFESARSHPEFLQSFEKCFNEMLLQESKKAEPTPNSDLQAGSAEPTHDPDPDILH